MSSHERNPALGIVYMTASMFCFSSMSAAVRYASFELPPTQLVFLRNFLSLLIMLGYVVWRERRIFANTHKKQHFNRALLGIFSMEIWFYALSTVPLPEATALSFVTPLFVTLFAIVFLKEKVGKHRITALMIGFLGVLVIIRPGMSVMQPEAMLVLFSSALIAVSSILIKQLTRTESPACIVFYMALFMTPLSLPLAVIYWETPSLHVMGVMMVVAITSTLAHILLAHSFKLADMTTVMPFDFTRLLFSTAFAWYLFKEPLDSWTFAGAAIIVTSTVYIAHREAKLRVRSTIPDTQD